jgi:drug/metabolite transporter (DMT)-like permease
MRYGTGMVLVLAAGVLWSFQALMIRQIDSAEVWAVLTWRSLAMLPGLLALVAWRSGGRPWAAIRATGWSGVLGGLGLVVAMGGAILAFQTTTIANAAFLLAASPFLAAVLGRVVLGEAVSARTGLAIAIAVTGIFIMVGDGLSSGAVVGNLAALLSALGFAAFTVALRWGRARDGLPASVIGAALAVAVGASMAAQNGATLAIPATDLMWCAIMGLVTMSGGMILYTFGSRVVPSAELTLLSNTEVLLAPFWVWLLLGETANAATFVGGGIVLLAILFNAFSTMRNSALA